MWPPKSLRPLGLRQSVAEANRIVPLHSHDASLPLQTLVSRFMLVFDRPLNVQRLKQGLQALSEIPGWDKMGARLKRRWDGSLEYHGLECSSAKLRFIFTEKRLELNLEDHALASRIPCPSERPAVVGNVQDWRPLMQHEATPSTIFGYTNRDIPQLAVHAVSFKNATIVSLSWPHTFSDGIGMAQLVEAWTSVLQTPSGDMPQVHGVDRDPLACLGRAPTEPVNWLGQHMSKTQTLGYICRKLPRYLFRRRANRIVCVPASFVETLREEASAGDARFVSVGDVLVAWWARLFFICTKARGTVNVSQVFSWRHRLPETVMPRGSVYLSNAIGLLQIQTEATSLLNEPLGATARRVRQAIVEQSIMAQIEAQEAQTKSTILGLPLLRGDVSTTLLLISNVAKLNLNSLDFSFTIDDGAGKPFSPTFSHCYNLDGIYQALAPTCNIQGKDSGGNYWISGSLEEETWNRIEAALSCEGMQI